MLTPGTQARVSVAVATLWTDPARVRPVDAPALRNPSWVRDWVAGMDDAARDDLDGRTLTQLLLGEPVLVDRVEEDWVRVVALEQPAAKLDPRGYPGWVPAAQLAGSADAFAADGDLPGYVVDATATTLRDAPDGDPVVPGLPFGSPLFEAGAPVGNWLPVHAPGRAEPLWALYRDVTPASCAVADLGRLVGIAERLLDTPYVWGGLSAYGVDCSGLVVLAARRLGVVVPRDADDQAAATRPVPLGDEQPGDLYFFARDGRPPHHVGIVAAPQDPRTGARRMVHACGTRRRVVTEEVTGERAATLVSAGRIGPGHPPA
jgi:gamma-D-glutamyl-L-lysine dipeptidyl-peptidase